ncbi:hypothetical protein NEOLEDRAFT_1149517 [Neolentinus lepideus HHB14362 ss-1]|uniref:Uncharacterized protein n=1 Tax=Neolentinus lepideus HHB14362 ss-1 TaxID=1314782 RepID=A0A165R328_9AGAM|nr:hypothetical protein NEOLEDRAFT_1149517 [Neolentinus lepideus HHB14362 ss-1]
MSNCRTSGCSHFDYMSRLILIQNYLSPSSIVPKLQSPIQQGSASNELPKHSHSLSTSNHYHLDPKQPPGDAVHACAVGCNDECHAVAAQEGANQGAPDGLSIHQECFRKHMGTRTAPSTSKQSDESTTTDNSNRARMGHGRDTEKSAVLGQGMSLNMSLDTRLARDVSWISAIRGKAFWIPGIIAIAVYEYNAEGDI